MKVEDSYEIDASVESVWDLLVDPGVLADLIPGAKSLEQVGENSYRATMDVGVGPVTGSYEGTVELIDPVRPESYTLKISAKGPGAFVTGESRFTLTALSDSKTRVDVEGEASFGGVLARVGQRLAGSAARSLMNQFFDNLKKRAAAG